MWAASAVAFAVLLATPALGGPQGTGTEAAAVVVVVTDAGSGRPIWLVDVSVRRPGWFSSDSHREPEWAAYTDTAGSVQLAGMPAGTCEVYLCHNQYEPAVQTMKLESSREDTLRASLSFLGRPPDGRRCEQRFG